MEEQGYIRTRENLKEYINYERNLYKCRKFERFFPISENGKLLFHIRLLRYTEYYLNTNKKIRYFWNRFRLRRFQQKYSLFVPLNCCKKGLRIMHLGPILINNKARIGCDVKMHMNSAIVAGGSNDYVPVIGDNVVIGYGAVILGNTRIAKGVAVGANAVVNKSIDQENVTIAGVPAKIISDKGSGTWGRHSEEKHT